jgi:small-conductance mechanosensitive channel
MNLQRLIDQHPSVFAAIFPIYFLCLWLLVGATISVIGGWFSLAKVYRTRVAFNGAKWRMQSGQMRWLANYNNVLTLGVSQQGLYLASMFLFRFMHPPLLVPWSEIKVLRSKGWVFEYVIFTMGHELAIPLRIREKLAAKLRESAGNYWPVEET